MMTCKDNKLIYRFDYETVQIEAWGPNALRVRASQNMSFTDHDWALEGSQSSEGDVTITDQGGTICNLAVKGTVKGDDHIGGVVGILQYGHLCNVYSEVSVPNCTDVRQGGICGAVAYGGFVDHCTQNAAVHSTDYDSQRGGIAGYSDGTIRYSVNNASVSHTWDCGGGIAGIAAALA